MQELVVDPKKFENRVDDHPLNQHEDSSWHAYFQVWLAVLHSICHLYSESPLGLLQDAEMIEQIDRDVMRTHPDMHFFSGDSEASILHREVSCNSSNWPSLCQT